MSDEIGGLIVVVIILAIAWFFGYERGKFVGQKQYASGIVNIIQTTNSYGEVKWVRK